MEENFPFERFFKASSEQIPPILKQKVAESRIGNPMSENSMPQSEIITINQNIHEQLSSSIGEQKYNTYFKSTFQLEEIVDDKIVFSAATEFIRSMIERHYQVELESAVNFVLGDRLKISIEVKSNNITANKQVILDNKISSPPQVPILSLIHI